MTIRIYLSCAMIAFAYLSPTLLAEEDPRDRRGRFFGAFDVDSDNTLTVEEIMHPATGPDLIIGAKGSSLKLTLNTLYHVSSPVENLPYSVYKDFIEFKDETGKKVAGKHASLVRIAIPYLLGDSYRNFRVVGTTRDLFDKTPYAHQNDGTPKNYTFSNGKNFQQEDFFGAVIGSVAARETRLKIGDQFSPSHGIYQVGDVENVHEKKFHVVGILDPTGTPSDRAIFVNMEGFYLVEGHAKPLPEGVEKPDHKSLPEEQREVTAILLFTRKPEGFDLSFLLMRQVRERDIAQVVFPVQVIRGVLSHLDDVSLFHELGAAMRAFDGKLDKNQYSAGLRKTK